MLVSVVAEGRNDRLREAIKNAGLTIGGMADQMGVDRKTAERWVAGRTPYDVNRDLIAGLLKTPASHLWPDEPETAPPGAQTAPAPEVEAIWPNRSAVPQGLWAELIDLAVEHVDIAAYAAVWLFELDAGLSGRLTAAAGRGARVRVALSRPNSARALARGKTEGIGAGLRQMAGLTWAYLAAGLPEADELGKPNELGGGLDLRDHDLDLPGTIVRADDHLLWAPHLAGLSERDSPVLYLRSAVAGPIGRNALRSLDWIMAHSKPTNPHKLEG